VVARTSSQTTVHASGPLELGPRRPVTPAGEKRERVIAVSLEGMLRSAFGHGRSRARSRLLVVASPQFFANPFARAGSAGGDAAGGGEQAEELRALATHYHQTELTGAVLALKNTLDWMTLGDDVLACLPAPGAASAKEAAPSATGPGSGGDAPMVAELPRP
jgi:hypothetical protein